MAEGDSSRLEARDLFTRSRRLGLISRPSRSDRRGRVEATRRRRRRRAAERSLEAESVHIDPSIIDAADPTLLEDAVLAALHDALGRSSSSGLRCILRLICRCGRVDLAVSWATSISRVSCGVDSRA